MITIQNVTKNFQETKALDDISLTIQDATVFGMLGTNGAGKSTLLRILAGVLLQDEGSVLFDGKEIYDNLEAKQEIFYLPDEVWYPENATIDTMRRFYAGLYKRFDSDSFDMLLTQLELKRESKIKTLSKGMKKQAFLLMAICVGTRYILCDEVFDGLDVVVAETIKRLILDIVKHRKVTFIMASHDLHELDDICDTFVLFHRGKMMSRDDIEQKGERVEKIHKVQCVLEKEEEASLGLLLHVISCEKKGIFTTLLVEGTIEKTMEVMAEKRPVCYEVIPLTLEETFMYEVKKVHHVNF